MRRQQWYDTYWQKPVLLAAISPGGELWNFWICIFTSKSQSSDKIRWRPATLNATMTNPLVLVLLLCDREITKFKALSKLWFVSNLTEPEINTTYLTTTSFVFCSMSCERSVPSSAPKCFSTTCWSSLLRSRGILFASFDSKARAAERTCFSSGTSSTWNAKLHTLRHKWQFIKLKPQPGHFVWESYHVLAHTLKY